MNSVYGALDISTRSIRQATQKKPVGVKGATLTGFLGRVGTESSLSSTSSVVSGTRQGQELHLRFQVGRTDTWCAATALPCRALPPTYGGTQLWALSPILSTFPCGLYPVVRRKWEARPLLVASLLDRAGPRLVIK